MNRTEFGWTWFCGCDDDGGAGDAAGGVVVVGKKCMMVVIGMMILYLLIVENFILAISWKTHTDRHEVPGPKKSKEGDGWTTHLFILINIKIQIVPQIAVKSQKNSEKNHD